MIFFIFASIHLIIPNFFRVNDKAPLFVILASVFQPSLFFSTQLLTHSNKSLPVVVSLSELTESSSSVILIEIEH